MNPGRFNVGEILRGRVRWEDLATPRSARSFAAGVILALLCLTVYLPGIAAIPPIDRDESRFAQASAQMNASGDFVVPRVQDRPRLNKPPLIYWLQTLSVRAANTVFPETKSGADGRASVSAQLPRIWPYRIPSVLCAISTVLIVWRLGCTMMDPRAAWLAGALLAVSPMILWDAHQARADQLLLFCTTGAMASLFVVWKTASHERSTRARKRLLFGALGFWVFMGLGILAKGPITPMVAGLTVIAVSAATRKWTWVWSLRPLVGVVVVAAMVAPWVIAIGERIGWSVYLQTVYAETIGRSTDIGGAEGHWGPPGYHLVLLVVLMWPGSLLTGLAIRRAWGRAKIRQVTANARSAKPKRMHFRTNAMTFLLAWVIPSWLVFELVSTKLPHYVMPLYPALCLLSARAVFAAEVSRLAGLRDRMTQLGFCVWSVFALPLSLATLPRIFGWRRSQFLSTTGWAIGGMVVTSIVLFEFILPQITAASTLVARAERMLNAASQSVRPFASVGYHEDSLIFLTRGRVNRIDVDAIDAWLEKNPNGIVAVQTSPTTTPDFSPESHGLVSMTFASGAPAMLEGLLNYSKGKTVTVEFFERAGLGTTIPQLREMRDSSRGDTPG